MAKAGECTVCDWQDRTGTTILITKTENKIYWARLLGVSKDAIRRHTLHPVVAGSQIPTLPAGGTSEGEASNGDKYIIEDRNRPVTMQDAREWLINSGDDPDDYAIDVRSTAYGTNMWSNTMSARSKKAAKVAGGLTEIARATKVKVTSPKFNPLPLVGTWKTAIGVADHQIGFRGEEAFHDQKAINIAHQIIGLEQPDQVVYCGDYMDFATLGKYEQENAFAGVTQKAFDYGHELLAIDRELAPKATLVLVEGNHDARMQKFQALNSPETMGLRRAGHDDEFPVMSVPYLLALPEIDVKYIDAYPAGKWWINDRLRAIHGNKVNSRGSTAAMYANEMPHISTLFGHTHRAEVLHRTTWDRQGKIVTKNINPGCMCRVDGEVPGVKGAVGLNGKAVESFEDWQNGLAVIRFKDSGEFFVELVEILDGVAIYDRQEIRG